MINQAQLNRTWKGDFKQVWYLKEAILLVWRSSPVWTTIRFLLLILSESLPLVRIYLSKLIIDTISQGFSLADKQNTLNRFWLLLTLMIILSVVGTLLSSANRIIQKYNSLMVNHYIDNLINKKAIELDLEYFETPSYYDLLSRAKQQSSKRCESIINRLSNLIRNSFSVTTMLGILLFFDWRIPLLMSISLVPRFFVRFKEINKIYQWDLERTSLQRKANYYRQIITTDNYIKEVRLFGLGNLFKDRYLKIKKQLMNEEVKISLRWAKLDIFTQLGSILVFQGTYALIAYKAIMGQITVGSLIMYYQFFQRGYNSVWQIFGSFSGLYEDNLFLSNFYEFLALDPKIIQPENPKQVPIPMEQEIKFEEFFFQYPDSKRVAIQNVSLSIKPGEVIALVGENGSGKTTLVKLLCRLYDPIQGKIMIDGRNLKTLDLDQWRQQISMVFQDYAKYQLTARENIWLGNINYPPDDDAIIAAASKSGIDKVISQLPNAYDTVLGKQFAQGEELSIGQWQKLIIAKAFLRNSQLIILDEPSSALDPKAEYELFQNFRQLLQGQSAVLISHRLSTVKMADHIYVLEKGQVIEHGTHQELIALGGLYERMFETQARNYR
ncbi:MAG: ABC transporter ATP-binding protein [Crocosphaera sp.]|nr:ABC transporter ATP-binding protein [Crocosphaera sp.]